MAIYFFCGTSYNIFVSYVISKTMYSAQLEKNLIINDSNKSAFDMLTSCKESSIWNAVSSIETYNKGLTEIREQIEKIHFSENDIVHIYAFGPHIEKLMEIIPDNCKLILSDEGYASYMIKEFCEKWKDVYAINYEQINFSRIDEIMLFNPRLSVNTLNKPIVKINFADMLENSFFFEEVSSELRLIFNQYQDLKDNWSMIFFDQCPSLIGQISREAELLLLEQLHQVTENSGLLIKRHPAEQISSKYGVLPFEFIVDRGAPWEAMYLNEIFKGSNIGKKIYMTYSSSSVFNSKIVYHEMRNDIYYIFLYKILENYMDEEADITFINTFRSFYGGKNIFEPASFEELHEILNEISSDRTPLNLDSNKSMTNSLELKWLRSFYKNNWKNTPPTDNMSTLILVYQDGTEKNIINKFDTSSNIFDFDFALSMEEQKPLKEIKWYAIRGRKVKIRIDSIEIRGMQREKIVIDENLIKHHGEIDKQNYIEFLNFDPTVFILYEGSITELSIKGAFKYDNAYASAVTHANKMASELSSRLVASIQENELQKNMSDLYIGVLDKIEQNISEAKLKNKPFVILQNDFEGELQRAYAAKIIDSFNDVVNKQISCHDELLLELQAEKEKNILLEIELQKAIELVQNTPFKRMMKVFK